MERPKRVTNKCGAVDLPDWLPQSVGDLAKVKSADLTRQSADSGIWRLLRRLVSDPRMRNVWHELQRRRRQSYKRTEIFIHPASTTKSWTTRGEWMREHAEKLRQQGGFQNDSEANRLVVRAALEELVEVNSMFPWYRGHPKLSTQDLALAFFFDQAFELGQRNIRLLPISEVRKKRHHYLEMAKHLRADAVEQERLGFYEGNRMSDAAFAYEELANAARPPPGNLLLVARQLRGDARLKGFVIALGDIAKKVFGTPLYGTIASTANVVFSRDDLTADVVRKMISHAPRA